MIENGRKIKIGYTSQHCCIRVIKISRALLKTGKYEIHGLANQLSYGTEFFNTMSFYHSNRQFAQSVRRMSDIDVWIHANEPNHQVNRIRRELPDAKIILDGHDFDGIRCGLIPLDEMRALTNCDGVIFVSDEVKAFMLELHRDQLKDKKVITLTHYCNDEFVPRETPSGNQRHGLVYEGGAQSPPYEGKAFAYRHLYPLFQQLVDQGVELHLMFGNIDATRNYSNIGAFVYEPQMYPELMKKMMGMKWGAIIFNNANRSQQQVNLTLCNKMFEYFACGLPIIVFGAPATEDWIKKNGGGIIVDDLKDITPQLLESKYAEKRAEVDKIRGDLTMEKHIGILDQMITGMVN